MRYKEQEEAMDTRIKYAVGIGAAVMFLLVGCAGGLNYGNLRPADQPGEPRIENLRQNWSEYTIYYAGLRAGESTDHASAVMFDPKNDDKTLKVSRWAKVEDEETLAKLIYELQHQPRAGGYYVKLWKLWGPEGQLYGYVYTPWHHVIARVTEPGTMYVFDLPLPPYLVQEGDHRKEGGAEF